MANRPAARGLLSMNTVSQAPALERGGWRFARRARPREPSAPSAPCAASTDAFVCSVATPAARGVHRMPLANRPPAPRPPLVPCFLVQGRETTSRASTSTWSTRRTAKRPKTTWWTSSRPTPTRPSAIARCARAAASQPASRHRRRGVFCSNRAASRALRCDRPPVLWVTARGFDHDQRRHPHATNTLVRGVQKQPQPTLGPRPACHPSSRMLGGLQPATREHMRQGLMIMPLTLTTLLRLAALCCR